MCGVCPCQLGTLDLSEYLDISLSTTYTGDEN